MEIARRALIVAGGTGGHLYPAIAIAKELQSSSTPGSTPWEILFVVRAGDRGKEILRRENFSVAELPGQGLARTPSLSWFVFPFKVLFGFIGAFQLIRSMKPKVVLGMGGYLTFPVLLAARCCGVRAIVHEQNVHPGLANRLVARFASGIALSFDESRSFFPLGKAWVSGLPVRRPIGEVLPEVGRAAFNLPEQVLTFLVFGGSQGAHHLNVRIIEAWRELMSHSGRFQVIHISGENDFEYLKMTYRGFAFKSLVMPYCHQMAEAYAAADVVISRAGASTVAELIAARRPSVLVPYPHASNDHQTLNAQVLASRGLAQLILERNLTPETLSKALLPYLLAPERLVVLRNQFNNARLPSVGQEAARKVALFMR